MSVHTQSPQPVNVSNRQARKVALAFNGALIAYGGGDLKRYANINMTSNSQPSTSSKWRVRARQFLADRTENNQKRATAKLHRALGSILEEDGAVVKLASTRTEYTIRSEICSNTRSLAVSPSKTLEILAFSQHSAKIESAAQLRSLTEKITESLITEPENMASAKDLKGCNVFVRFSQGVLGLGVLGAVPSFLIPNAETSSLVAGLSVTVTIVGLVLTMASALIRRDKAVHFKGYSLEPAIATATQKVANRDSKQDF